MELGIAGRVALVTAGTKGLGLASALALAGDGCRVVVCSRSADNVAAAERALAATGAEVLGLQADINEPEAPERVVAAAVERFGTVDILVGSTGGPRRGAALELSDSDILAAVECNLLSQVRLVRAVVPHMRAGRWGRICLITANGIRQPKPSMALSATARTGLWGWAKSASSELFADGITINTVCPGAHDTAHNRAMAVSTGPRGDAADFGQVVAFLCSRPAGWINGAAINVDGGATLSLL